MQADEIDEIIAERTMTIGRSETAQEVTVLLAKPRKFPDSTDYYSLYQIRGVGAEKIRFSGGIDAFQSLQLALKMIGDELEAINRTLDEKLWWEGDEHGFLGFRGRELAIQNVHFVSSFR